MEWQFPSQHLIEHYSQRVNVGAPVDVDACMKLLRTRVVGCPVRFRGRRAPCIGNNLPDAEVEHLHKLSLRSIDQHYVRWLQITMNYVCTVSSVQGRC